MVKIRAKYILPLVLAATSAGFTLPSGIAEETRARPLRLAGLRLLNPYSETATQSLERNTEGKAVPHQSFAGPQRIEPASSTPTESAVAPGVDATRYVPGSTVGNFFQEGTISLGRILIKPSGTISYVYESNLLALNSGYGSDRALSIVPSVEVFIPFLHDGIRLAYSFPYRQYQKFNLAQNFEQSLNADSEFVFSPILTLGVREHFSVSAVNSQEFTPGREVIFSDSPFKRNDVGLQMTWTISENDSLGFNADWNRVFFDQQATAGQTPFYDYNQYNFGGTYKRELSERFSVFANGSYSQNSTGDPRDVSNSKGFGVTGGIDGAITPLITGQFGVGVTYNRYPGAVTRSATGLVFRGSFSKEITERSQVSVSMSRASNMSYFQENAYFVTTGIGASYSRELGPRLSLSVSSGYQRNGYPLPLEASSGVPVDLVGKDPRRDSFVDMGLGVRYRYNDWLAMDVRFDISRRFSDVPQFRFQSYRGGINLLIGSRGSSTGRSPY